MGNKRAQAALAAAAQAAHTTTRADPPSPTSSCSSRGNTKIGGKEVEGGGEGMMPDTKGELTLTVPSLEEIKKNLPADCFRSSPTTSLYYVARSIVFVTILLFAFLTVRSTNIYATSWLLRTITISLYWFLQGTVFWGIFVLGHDCGHGSFSSNYRLNWVTGNALHTFILVPYESWRVTHRHHHKNTGHIDNDEIFFPLREDQYNFRVKLAPYFMGLAWFYYIFRGHFPRNVHHLNSEDPLFVKYKSQTRVAASLYSMIGWLIVLWRLSATFGYSTVGVAYFGPLVVFGSWLVIVTFLHHQEENTPWFADETWDYVKGNLSSIDRSYWPLDDVIHNIGTHQIHHLFPVIPHYKLKAATAAFRKHYPHLVRESKATAIPAFIKSMGIYTRQAPLAKTANYWVFQ